MDSNSGDYSSLSYASLITSDDHIDVFDVGGCESDDRLHQLNDTDYLLEAATELLQFVDGLDGLILKTEQAEQVKPKEEPVSPPSHVLDHNYASASPNPLTKKTNQTVHNRRNDPSRKMSYNPGRQRNGPVF
ncbi:Hypothetical protein NTJ_01843 [Nesidiocoris tenuis]|uniref:Uncharacterized protein n=1 Tax=Nesidiocoris tenuis TaxID=355587 RepID=A0ABN7A9P8_9HEMI|nr:Hypothetical protein NTJ_01843 [Nesidiocoris tenuis]